MRVTAVVLAAGRGDRMGGEENKAFLAIAGVPLLRRAVDAFRHAERVDEVVVVARPGEEPRVRELLDVPSVRIVPGGRRRRDSAFAGVSAASGELVLIHDGARPFPTQELVGRVIDATIRHGACVPVLPIPDTLRIQGTDGFLTRERPERSKIVRMQTPQGFRAELIREAIAESADEIPDDAEAVLTFGRPVATVTGEATNLKVTTPADVPLAEAIAAHWPPTKR